MRYGSPVRHVCTLGITLLLLQIRAVAWADDSSGGASAPGRALSAEALQGWLHGPIQLSVRSEVTDATCHIEMEPGTELHSSLGPLPLVLNARWEVVPEGLHCQLDFSSDESRSGYTVTLELPVLAEDREVFTPSERGVMSLAVQPTFEPVRYGHMGWNDGRFYVLPLVSVFQPTVDQGLTIALEPDTNIPHLQVSWQDAKTLRLQLAHRGMGGGIPSPLRILFYAHQADYRSVLRSYIAEFPRYFQPHQPRGPYEGAFWYHHIHEHPDFEEMSRQHVRFIWSSFWFTHLGEYLPDEPEWFPFTYAKWWALQEPMNDGKIRDFARAMHDHGMGVFAYFNVTEYGGAGGKEGDEAEAAKLLQEQFADALMKDEAGRAIPTWEGAMAMNARRDCALFPALADQARRHLQRLPELDGFIIDRLDWGSHYDYAHDDGLTMFGKRRAENMAGPVGVGVAEVCRQAHEAGWRVYVNQFWRVEMLCDVDGYCHESDIVRGLGYLAPLRPASAWHMRKAYQGDLLQFEGQLKNRLQFAIQPQMIAHQFPISQQGPDPEAADLLEIYGPLFAALDGKIQVLTPHCVSATDANDVNLFLNRGGQLVMPLTSRTRFLSRRVAATEDVTITLRRLADYSSWEASGDNGSAVPERRGVAVPRWAWVLSADQTPYRADIALRDGEVDICVARHGTASVVVAGSGPAPQFDQQESQRLASQRDQLFPPPPARTTTAAAAAPDWSAVRGARLAIAGVQLGEPGPVKILFQGRTLGELRDVPVVIPVTVQAEDSLAVELQTGDEGTWFLPHRIRLLALLADEHQGQAAEWLWGDKVEVMPGSGRYRYPLQWRAPERLPTLAGRFEQRTADRQGKWTGHFGKLAAWIPAVNLPVSPHRYELQAGGQPFVWQHECDDDRVLSRPAEADSTEQVTDPRPATCWFASEALPLTITPADDAPYRVTLYLLDFDRNGRAVQVVLEDTFGTYVDSQEVSTSETAQGIYLSWTVAGEVTITLRKLAGFNVVASGVFVDRPDSAQ